MSEAERRQEMLTEALVGEKTHLYITNTMFRETINNLVSLLPLWIDSIAKRSIEYSEHQEKLEKLIKHNLGHVASLEDFKGHNLSDQPGDFDDK